MTTLLLLLASFALVALIGAALMYAVNRLVAWSVDRIEGRGGMIEVPASSDEPAPTTAAITPEPVAVATAAVAPSDLVTPAAPAPAQTVEHQVVEQQVVEHEVVEHQVGPASTAA